MMWRRLFTDAVTWRELLLAVLPTLAIAWLLARTVRLALTRLLSVMVRDVVTVSSPFIRAPLRLIGLAVFTLAFGVLIVPAFELAGVRPRVGVHLRTLTTWAFDSGLRILLILVVAYAVIRAVSISIQRFEQGLSLGEDVDALERVKRARTLGGVLTSITTIAVSVIAFLMILREFAVDIGPALTTAGVAGVALGFGAQTLVKDLIGGFFLILENQVRVGDVASINGIGGLVEAINLRTIVLRDYDGTVYIVPNGSIGTLANRTKDFSYYVIDVPVAYRHDTDTVVAILRGVGEELQQDDQLGPHIMAPLEIAGVDAFGNSDVKIKIRIKTAPLKQWDVGRELRRRIKKAFDERGIEIPFPQQVVHVRTEDKAAQ